MATNIYRVTVADILDHREEPILTFWAASLSLGANSHPRLYFYDAGIPTFLRFVETIDANKPLEAQRKWRRGAEWRRLLPYKSCTSRVSVYIVKQKKE